MRFTTAALPFALVLGAGGIEAGLRRLRRYLPEVRRRLSPAAALDLRFSGRIVAVPTAGAARRGRVEDMARPDPNLVAIDIGSSKVAVLIAKPQDNGELEVVGKGRAPNRGTRKGNIVNVEPRSTP